MLGALVGGSASGSPCPGGGGGGGGTGEYELSASNGGMNATSGTVTVSDSLPSALTASSATGSGWSCNVSPVSCTRSDALAAGASYPAITLIVKVAQNASGTVTNQATVSGGGPGSGSASEQTPIGSGNGGKIQHVVMADLYFLLHTTADRTEGIRAFLEKRKPDFKGK